MSDTLDHHLIDDIRAFDSFLDACRLVFKLKFSEIITETLKLVEKSRLCDFLDAGVVALNESS